jgi:hypothetical protein
MSGEGGASGGTGGGAKGAGTPSSGRTGEAGGLGGVQKGGGEKGSVGAPGRTSGGERTGGVERTTSSDKPAAAGRARTKAAGEQMSREVSGKGAEKSKATTKTTDQTATGEKGSGERRSLSPGKARSAADRTAREVQAASSKKESAEKGGDKPAKTPKKESAEKGGDKPAKTAKKESAEKGGDKPAKTAKKGNPETSEKSADGSKEKKDGTEKRMTRQEAYDKKIAELMQKPNLTPKEQKMVREAIDATQKALKSSTKRLEQMQEAARKAWLRIGRGRGQFARDFGNAAHKDIQQELNGQLVSKGSERGKDHFIEKTIKTPGGRVIRRLDAVIPNKEAVFEIKPDHKNDTVGDQVARHYRQLKGYIRAYRQNFGHSAKNLYLRIYPGTHRLGETVEQTLRETKDGGRAPKVKPGQKSSKELADEALNDIYKNIQKAEKGSGKGKKSS